MPQPKDKDWLNGYKNKTPTRDPPQNRGHIRLKVKGWKKIFHANRDQKKAGVAILISYTEELMPSNCGAGEDS